MTTVVKSATSSVAIEKNRIYQNGLVVAETDVAISTSGTAQNEASATSVIVTRTVRYVATYVKDGKDDEFFKSAESLIWTVENGPFYVTKGYNAVLGALGGVNVTEKLEVLTAKDQIIPGLYATGNNLSGISVAAYGNVEGVGLSTALTTGRLAGVYAAQYIKK